MILKNILILILICFSSQKQRNLQFTHFVPGYTNHQPEDQTYGFFPFLNSFDPYLPISFTTGVGSNLNGLQFVVQCKPPLELINGACQCPQQGRLIDGNCFTGTIDLNNQIQPDQLSGLALIVRQFDGTNNNKEHPQWGSKNSLLQRRGPAFYKDNYSQPIDFFLSTRIISNELGHIKKQIKKKQGVTMAFVIFGQFLDHDLDLTESGISQQMNIPVPPNDQFFINKSFINFHRSIFRNSKNQRNHQNILTAWIDGSQIYGNDKVINRQIRSFTDGKMRISQEGFLPKRHGLFIAGDARINQNAILTSYHTVFAREHNRICDRLLEAYPQLHDQQLFEAARNYVIGLLQKITFQDFLPILIGKKAYDQIIGSYQGYKENINPNIATQFSSAAFRFGHSLIVDKYPLFNESGHIYSEHRLNELFFNPSIVSNNFIDGMFRGLQINLIKQKGSQITSQLRNLLVSDPGNRQIRLDLFALNIQRGRDHGIPTYNQARKAYGLPPLLTFEQLLPQQQQQTLLKLKQIYNSPDNLQLWVGIISEKSLEGGILGELGAKICGETFRNLRDGDRYWYQSVYPQVVVSEIKQTTFSDIIRRTTNAKQIQDNIFKKI